MSIREKLQKFGLTQKYGEDLVPLHEAVKVIPEDELRVADRLASSPEEWTDLTGIKLGQQRG